MADAGLHALATELTCPACQKIYDNPVMLKCQHSLCKTCAEKRVEELPDEKPNITCPISDCKATHVLGKKGTDGIPKNLALGKVSGVYRALYGDSACVVLCSLCEEDPRPAVKTCLQCDVMSYCDDCLGLFHPMMGMMKHHDLVNVDVALKMNRKSSKAAEPPTVVHNGLGRDSLLGHLPMTTPLMGMQFAPMGLGNPLVIQSPAFRGKDLYRVQNVVPQNVIPQPARPIVKPVAVPESLSAATLAVAPPQEQKQMLGEKLFPLIQKLEPDLAGKITGMLLEMDNSSLLDMIKSMDALKFKVTEAVAVLNAGKET